MLLESIEALNFRNLVGGAAFSPGLNILTGENGQGKTNWLEAIAVLASTRSFRTAGCRRCRFRRHRSDGSHVRELADTTRIKVTITAIPSLRSTAKTAAP
jgi:recombinational DNA repair ATPase RecF